MAGRPGTSKFKLFGINLHQIFEIVCTLGFLVQSILVLVKYFSYDTITRVYLRIPEVTPLPDIVMCFDTAFVVNYTKLLEQYPEFQSMLGVSSNSRTEEAIRRDVWGHYSKWDIIDVLANQLTIREISSVIYTNEELIRKIQIIEFTPEQSREMCQIRNVHRNFRYCYVYSCSLQSPVNYSVNEADQNSLAIELFTSSLDHGILREIPNFFITLVHPNNLPRGNLLRWDTLMIYPEPRYYKIHFYLFEQGLLPSPYSSDCRDYSKSGYKSAIEMKDICFNNRSLELVGVPFHSATLPPDVDAEFGFVKYSENQFNDTFRRILDKIIDECFEMTAQPDCYTLQYFIRPRNPVPVDGKYSIINVDQIKEPTISVKMEPRLSFSECVISIGSISGTWFGFSIVEHIPKLVKANYWKKVAKWIAVQAMERQLEKRVIRRFRKSVSMRVGSIYSPGHIKPSRFQNHTRYHGNHRFYHQYPQVYLNNGYWLENRNWKRY